MNQSDFTAHKRTELLSFTNLEKGFNPLWKAQAFCRRTRGRFYLYEQPDGNIEVSEVEKYEGEILEVWRDGVRTFYVSRKVKTLSHE